MNHGGHGDTEDTEDCVLVVLSIRDFLNVTSVGFHCVSPCLRVSVISVVLEGLPGLSRLHKTYRRGLDPYVENDIDTVCLRLA